MRSNAVWVFLLLLPTFAAASISAAAAVLPWRCDVPSQPNSTINGYSLFAWDGTNPYCLSLDGRTCWSDKTSSCKQKQQKVASGLLKRPAIPLVCGEALKAATGETGYETATHWCSITRRLFSAPAKACLAKPKARGFSYSTKTCIPGKLEGGAKCSRHSDCASDLCVFSCPWQGVCAWCKQDSDCPKGSKCWVTKAKKEWPFRPWTQELELYPAVPMCGLACRPELGHVCACGATLARGNSSQACPPGYYCSGTSYGDGCYLPPQMSDMTSCLKKVPRFADTCEDIEGNLEPDEACEGPKGQQGLCLFPKHGVHWPSPGFWVYRRCTHRCNSDADCYNVTSVIQYNDAASLSGMRLCDVHRLFYANFSTCVIGETRSSGAATGLPDDKAKLQPSLSANDSTLRPQFQFHQPCKATQHAASGMLSTCAPFDVAAGLRSEMGDPVNSFILNTTCVYPVAASDSGSAGVTATTKVAAAAAAAASSVVVAPSTTQPTEKTRYAFSYGMCAVLCPTLAEGEPCIRLMPDLKDMDMDDATNLLSEQVCRRVHNVVHRAVHAVAASSSGGSAGVGPLHGSTGGMVKACVNREEPSD